MKHMACVSIVAASLLAACGSNEPAKTSRPEFNIDLTRVSVSGVSSGAYMAGQLHVAHSSLFSGAGLVAGGPYGCARGELAKALGACLKGGGELRFEALLAAARQAQEAGQIDALENLDDDTVWLFHGANDVIVAGDLTRAAARFYKSVAPAATTVVVSDVETVHGLPTLGTGVACNEFAAPYLNACGYDAAGEILKAIHGPLAARTEAAGKLQTVSQPGAKDAQMLPEALLYVPVACAQGKECGLHVALHGCSQSTAYVDNAFVTGAGFNEWAEANRLLVLYPQVASSKLMPMNPQGCWDWWGYTGEHYATRDGLQIAAITQMVYTLAGTAP